MFVAMLAITAGHTVPTASAPREIGATATDPTTTAFQLVFRTFQLITALQLTTTAPTLSGMVMESSSV